MMRLLLPLLLLACLAGSAAAADVPAEAQRAYLRDRDIARLLTRMEAADAPPAALLNLARLAAGKPVRKTPDGVGGVDGIPAALVALRAGRLEDARRIAGRIDPDGGLAGAWLEALLRLRRGDDAGAIGRLLAPPFIDWDRDAFPLALMGAALPDQDRWMLAAGARVALERAAARGRTRGVIATALGLAALEPEAGLRGFSFAIDALRRSGEPAEAARLLALGPRAGVSPMDPMLSLQAALLAWEQGEIARMPALLAGRPPPGAQAVYLPLRGAQRRTRTIPTGRPVGHVPGARGHAVVIARLATGLGRVTSAAEVERWCRQHKRPPQHAGTPRAWLEAHGFHVLSLAGDSAAGDAMLIAGLPFVAVRLAASELGYGDGPALVTAFDRRTGLWLLDEPDVRRPDIALRASAPKFRLLCAVPKGRRSLLTHFEGSAAARAGRLLEAALDEADRGALEAALARLGPAAPARGGVVDLYRAHLLHRSALVKRAPALWKQLREALDRSRTVAPMLAFEARARGEALIVETRIDDALNDLDRAVLLEGQTAGIALTRFTAQRAKGARVASLAALETARRLAPLDVRILQYRASLLAADGETARARADLRRVLERRPDALGAAIALSAIEIESGDPQAALAVLEEAERRSRTLKRDPVLRAARRRAELAAIEAAKTVDDLRSSERSPDPAVRRSLAYALADRAAEGDAAEALLRKLLSDEVAEVRATTLRLYKRPWLRTSIETDAVLAREITRLLEKDPSGDVRQAAAALLGRVRSPLSCRALSAAVGGETRDMDAGVRRAAARALGGHAVEACRAVLIVALEDDDGGVRKAAIDTLFELTGAKHGFEPDDPAEKRKAAVDAWRAWLTEK